MTVVNEAMRAEDVSSAGTNASERVCSRFHIAVECIGARWSGAIIRSIFTGSHRYADLKLAVSGVSDTMLSLRLQELEAEGIVERRVLSTQPVRVEYHLTAKGVDLEPVIDALIGWSHKWVQLPPA
jgi:DNA-binding HxlR family transcriptional regulator